MAGTVTVSNIQFDNGNGAITLASPMTDGTNPRPQIHKG